MICILYERFLFYITAKPQSRSQTLRVTGEQACTANVAELEVQHKHTLETCGSQLHLLPKYTPDSITLTPRHRGWWYTAWSDVAVCTRIYLHFSFA